MTRTRKLFAWVIGILALLEQVIRLAASLVMLLAVLFVMWIVSIPHTFYEAYVAICGLDE